MKTPNNKAGLFTEKIMKNFTCEDKICELSTSQYNKLYSKVYELLTEFEDEKQGVNKIIIDNNQVLKNIEDKKIFVNALLNPPLPGERLKNAFERYKQNNINGNSRDEE